LPVTRLVSENWWVGPGGTCGPDSEMFVWTGPGDPEGDPSTDPRWVEVWNHVSMRYQDTGEGLVELPRRCVDTGMGLERLLMVLQGKDSIYGTDLFEPWMTLVGSWGLDGPSRRVVVDHLRSLVVVSGDGVRPSNTGRGYVPRRLLRRGLTELWNTRPDLGVPDVPDEVIGSTLEHFDSRLGVTDVRDVLEDEQRRYRSLLERGRRVVERHLRGRRPTGEDYRYLHDTQGLPRDVVDRLVPR
jgi:alanyl-tRNA synthetase